MARLRLFLAWLLLLALPLHGFAAAAVLQCGPAQRALAAAGADEWSAQDGRGHLDGHRAHAAQDGAAQHEAGHAHAAHAEHAPAPSADTHDCFACAAACHAPALAGDPPRIDVPPSPHVHAVAPFLGFESRPPPVPDKPPRA